MLAALGKKVDGYLAQFNRPMEHSIENVWSALTENEKLKKWMPNLRVEDLGKGGRIIFHMNDGTGSTFPISIIDYKIHSYFQYEWGKGSVRFELFPIDDGTLLILKEYIPVLTEHTSKDLAGWHVCLDVFNALLKGEEMDFPKEEWEKHRKDYARIIDKYRG
ncbi:SRPBCC family protein [Falsibacillus albus]|uniref:SRPBCC family protein n=1 Tax=Falsibacillus albus TaxID=2478915 RepID=A0A3L7K3P2_9BACI|nr:SRPBCC family protein [Falsibacillus albus]RLQ97450.1 SRPBCC family protein [Falsibacillus albus]